MMRPISTILSSPRTHRWILIILCVPVVVGGVQSALKADRGAQAIVRWRPLLDRLAQCDDVYIDGTYPNPPLLGLLLYSTTKLPPVSAAIVWYIAKVVMAALSLLWALQISGCHRSRLLAFLLVLFLGLRPLLSDLQHGNVNILILFLVMASLRAYHSKMDVVAGLTLALATVFKVTPALCLPYFALKRRWTLVAVASIAIVAGLVIAPGFVLGQHRNLQLLHSWTRVMIAPYVVHGQIETTQVNQSLPGVFMRLVTASPGIEVGDDHTVPVNWFAFEPAQARIVLRVLLAALLICLWYVCRLPAEREHWRSAAELASVMLVMLFFSERSWKHHYVTMTLPYAVLVTHFLLRSEPGSRARRWIASSLGLSFLLMLSTSSAVGGWFASGMGHKYAQAYGLFFLSGVVVFSALSILLIRSESQAHTLPTGT